MKPLKVLNNYAGIGGNRKLWEDVEVTAIEYDPEIAKVYQDFFPDDKVIVTDAHQYLLEHFSEFDFIWSSPPCPTHSTLRHLIHANKNKARFEYPDMRLYQEVLILDHWFKGLYCVENVISYYDPLIKPQKRGRHYYWANFLITPIRVKKEFNIANTYQTTADLVGALETRHGITLPEGTKNKEQLLRNCVYPPLGYHILNCARGNTQKTLAESVNNKTKRINDE